MATVASCTAFSYSHWNAFVNDEMKIVVGCKEQLVDQSTVDVSLKRKIKIKVRMSFMIYKDDLQCIVFTSELVGFTDICESAQEFVQASTFSDVRLFSMNLIFNINLFLFSVSCGIISFSTRKIFIGSICSCYGC
jgi:hypothetical protein